MQTFTLQEITRRLGISLNDLVRYRKQGDKGIIEIDLNAKKRNEGSKEPIDLFANIYSMSEDVGIDDWALNHDHYLYGNPKRNEEESKDG